MLLIVTSKQFDKLNMFVFIEKCSSVSFSLTSLYQLTNHPADIPCYSLAIFTATLTDISYIKTKKMFKVLQQILKYFRMNFI
jgi:hypothetical protein